jgi:hypothetical protein
MWDLTPDLNIHIEAVHRLNSSGAVVTHTGSGTSPEGFDAEWRAIDMLTVEGGRISRCAIFDEADLDAALAHFDELQTQAARLGCTGRNTSGRLLHGRSPSFGRWRAPARSRCHDRQRQSER